MCRAISYRAPAGTSHAPTERLHMAKTRKSSFGFTLVEIMIVVACIGLLVALMIPAFAKARKSAITQRCIENQRLIFQSVERYEIDNGRTLYSIRNDGVQVRNTLLAGGYMNPQTSFDCPSSQVKDYDDYLLIYDNNDFVTVQCTIDPTGHVLP